MPHLEDMMAKKTITVVVRETANHHIPVPVDDTLIAKAAGAGFSADHTGLSRYILEELSTDDAVINETIGDQTLTAVTDREVIDVCDMAVQTRNRAR